MEVHPPFQMVRAGAHLVILPGKGLLLYIGTSVDDVPIKLGIAQAISRIS